MQLHTSEALLLDVFDLAEYDRIVSFLTPEQGRLKGVARGARRKHSRFAGQLQPLAKVELTWFAKESRELVRISSVDLVRPAERLGRDLETLLVGGYLADHVLEFAQEYEESRRLYRLLDSTVAALLGGVDVSLAARYFEVWVLRLSGVFPEPSECARCGASVLERGATLPHGETAFVCRDCHRGSDEERVSDEALRTLVRMRFQSLPEMAAEPPAAEALRGVEAICRIVRRHFLQKELRSYRVLQQALNP
jgi:DNA repair protein RecO (recombination protein O)